MTTFHDRRRLLQGLGGAACLGLLPATPAALAADPAPTAAPPGRIVFGFGMGGPLTELAKVLVPEFSARAGLDFGTDLVYAPGNSTARAMAQVRAAAPDGNTLLLTPAYTLTLLPQLRRLPQLDPAADFEPVAMVAEYTWFFCVGAAVPATIDSLASYLKWASRLPGQAVYASAGPGTTPHVVGQILASAAGVALQPQAYSSIPTMAKEVVSGAVPAGFLLPGLARAGLANGTLRALFVVSGTRWPGLLQVPTLRELGIVDLGVVDNYGLYVRTGSAPERVEALHRAAVGALAVPQVLEALARTSVIGRTLSRREFAEQLTAERAMWRRFVERERISIDG